MMPGPLGPLTPEELDDNEEYTLQATYTWPMTARWTQEIVIDDEGQSHVEVNVYDVEDWPDQPEPMPDEITGWVDSARFRQDYVDGQAGRLYIKNLKLEGSA